MNCCQVGNGLVEGHVLSPIFKLNAAVGVK